MMLETIREYAAHKLRVNGEASTVGGSHAAYMVALAERVEPDLLAGDAAAFELLEVEHDNLRAALDWAHATGRHDLELRLAGAIWWFWYLRVHRTEGLARLDEALAGAGATVGAARAKALRGRGLLRARGGRFEEAEADARELLALAADVADPGLHAQALHLLAGVEHQRGDYAGARRLYEESAALSRQTGDVQLLARLLANGLADIALNERRFEDAAAVAREALVIARASGGAEPVIIPLQNLASALLVLARAGEATEYFVESLGHATEIHDHESIAWALAGLGAAAAELGHAERAARLLGAVDAALAARELELQRFEADRHEQVIARLRRDLGEEAFTAAWAQGHAMTRDEASAFALSGVTDQERPR
jgi:tetratricopeptide (TPR) repeat protein